MKKSSSSKFKYTPKYFSDNLPAWKKRKDPPLSRVLYRPLSFVTASVATRFGISANTVSYCSFIIAIAACVLLIIPNRVCNIIGAIFVNLWLLSDCTDGNIARSVKKQPFGAFADSISSYLLVAFLGISLGIYDYFNDGLLVNAGNIWLVLVGAIASISDTLMRLVYNKYKISERELVDAGRIKHEVERREDNNQSGSLIVRIESDFGIGGWIPIIVLLGVIFNFVDTVTIYCCAYYGLSALVMISKYVRKAIKKQHYIEAKERDN